MNSHPTASNSGPPKKIVKLSRTPGKSPSPSPSQSQYMLEGSSKGNEIMGERSGMVGGREGLLGEYYDNLERVALELARAQEFLQCYKHLH